MYVAPIEPGQVADSLVVAPIVYENGNPLPSWRRNDPAMGSRGSLSSGREPRARLQPPSATSAGQVIEAGAPDLPPDDVLLLLVDDRPHSADIIRSRLGASDGSSPRQV